MPTTPEKLRPFFFVALVAHLVLSATAATATTATTATLAITPAPASARAADPTLAPLIERLTGFVAASYDSARGGFVTRDRTPNESAIELAWRLAPADDVWRRRARTAVVWTWSLFDSVGGGFLLSERDARHDVATFDKRTDANSWRLENRVDAWLDARRRGRADDDDLRKIRQILDFFERVLLDARGGFIAGQVGDRELVPAQNGPAIRAYLDWAGASGETRWRDFAWKSLDRVWTGEWNPDFGLLRLGAMGEVISIPKLEDQVEMGRAFVLAAWVGGRESDLQRARALADVLLARFEDRKLGGLRVQVALAKDGRVKGAARDAAPNARAARFFAELAALAGDAKYRDAARRLVDHFVPGRNRGEVDDADWVLAMRMLDHPELPEKSAWKTPEKSPPPTPQVIRIGKKRS